VPTDHIRSLFEKYISGTSSSPELEELGDITDQYSNDELADILEPLAMKMEGDPNFRLEEWESVIRSILEHPPLRKARIISWRSWYRVAAAAAIILMLVTAGYLLFNKNTVKQVAKTATPALKNDVAAPSGNKAVITLANGKQITLDSARNGTLVREGNVAVEKLADGEIAYNALQQSQGEIQYNTLTNPRGSKVISLTLSDGTKVWLNSGSSLKYPTAFAANERNVEITGEAYFEVTHNATMPFKVKKGTAEVSVLGTHFNVNAYDDEPTLSVTLLQGSVKVSIGSRSVIIKPGQQATAINPLAIRPTQGREKGLPVNSEVNLEQVMAWKNGLFVMNKTSIGTIMRQIARWYDVDVTYTSGIPAGRISGDIPRTMDLSKVLEVMELSGVRFTISGRKLIVEQ